jgi:ribose transport system permease protein
VSAESAVAVAAPRGPRFSWREARAAAPLPVLAFAAIFIWIVTLESQALSYDGLTLLISTAVPLVFATLAQMLVIMLGDIDLGIGAFIGMTNALVARYLVEEPILGLALLAAAVAGYGLMGLLIQVRRIPSIVCTLGASFVWFGLALLVLPSPGGSVPGWLASFWDWRPPLVPLPVLIAIVAAAIGYLVVARLPYGVVMRGAGDDPVAVGRAGWSVTRVRVTVYALAGVLGVLAGLMTTAVTASGDPGASQGLTLLAVAAVVLGGGEFSGGVARPVGAVIGALAISLVVPLLALLSVSSDYQTGVQGAILIAVLAGRMLIRGAD